MSRKSPKPRKNKIDLLDANPQDSFMFISIVRSYYKQIEKFVDKVKSAFVYVNDVMDVEVSTANLFARLKQDLLIMEHIREPLTGWLIEIYLADSAIGNSVAAEDFWKVMIDQIKQSVVLAAIIDHIKNVGSSTKMRTQVKYLWKKVRQYDSDFDSLSTFTETTLKDVLYAP